MAGDAGVVGQWGPIAVYAFGLAAALGFALGTATSLVQAARLGVDAGDLFRFAPLGMAAGVIGARIGYVIVNAPGFLADPGAVVRLSEGGFAYYGGLAGGALALLLYAHRRGLDFWRLLDAAAPGLALGQAVGLAGAGTVGRSASVLWAVDGNGGPVHPVGAYGIAVTYFIFAVLWHLGRRAPSRGRLFLVYLLLHGIGFALVGTWTAGPRMAGLAPVQWAGLAAAGLALASLILLPPAGRGPVPHRWRRLPAAVQAAPDSGRWLRVAVWASGLLLLLALYRARTGP
ncbi:MAG: prolipoprotein diacylglyceryl transferase [Firmicutes bacterium]|nr:prolipoprotein diacylglyceryl transferase [Bacillota bacterium]